MNSHLSELRLIELSAGHSEPSARERLHLEACRGCADSLIAERELTAGLAALRQPSAPRTLPAVMLARFAAEHQRRRRRVRVLWLSALLGTVGGLVPALALTMIFCIRPWIVELAWLVKLAVKLATLTSSMMTLLPRAPWIPGVLAVLALMASGIPLWGLRHLSVRVVK